MSMKDFNCDMLELSFRFTPEEIDQDAFLKAFEIEEKEKVVDAEGDIFVTKVFGRREKTTDYHAHGVFLLEKSGKGRIDIRYHNDPLDIEDEQPPHAEECAQWLDGIFKSEEKEARVTATYDFDKSYATTIAFPFPLATTEKALAGCSVVGVAVQFPKEGPFEMAIVQQGEKGAFLTASTRYKIRFKDFDLSAELEKLSTATSSLVRKQEHSEETPNVQSEE
jgi:hypothetical protein